MDSSFCVSKGIVEMYKKLGVFGQALIKKCGANLPKGVPGIKLASTLPTRLLDTVKCCMLKLKVSRCLFPA